MMAGVAEDGEPAFVLVMVAPEQEDRRPAHGSITIEFSGGVMNVADYFAVLADDILGRT
jgi:hypothetical protein